MKGFLFGFTDNLIVAISALAGIQIEKHFFWPKKQDSGYQSAPASLHNFKLLEKVGGEQWARGPYTK